MKSIGINRFDEGDIVPGQSENSFSGQDYKNGPGYLAGKKGIFYQNGEDTSIKYADYPEGWKP